MTDLERGRHKMRRLIAAAKHERDMAGYRENLGFDQYPKLQGYLAGLDLTYIEQARILSNFARACDTL